MKKKTKKVLGWVGIGVAAVTTVVVGVFIYNAGYAAGNSDTVEWFEDMAEIIFKPSA
jgi:hypothetical protein